MSVQLQAAYDQGIRHVQLVHYIRNTLGDFQTERPEHSGLSELGKAVVQECNRLGMLVDLAHCTGDAVRDALAVAKAPIVWSHSSVTRTREPGWSMPVWQARQLGRESGTSDRGAGVAWSACGRCVRRRASVGAYADRLAEIADWLGEDHAAFGTDMNGIANPVIARFADLQRVVGALGCAACRSAHPQARH